MGLEDFEQNLGKLVDTCTKLGIILDFDGTLSFLAQKPALAIIPPETRKALERSNINCSGSLQTVGLQAVSVF